MAQAKGNKIEEKKEETESTLVSVRTGLLKPLENVKLSDLKLGKKAVVLDSSTDPKKAIEILLKNKVRAAPVKEKNNFIGVLDLRDTVKFALDSYKKSKDGDKHKKQDDNKAMQWLALSPQITTQTLKYLSRMRHFETVNDDDTVIHVLKILAKGAHIVGIKSKKNGTLLSIVTQGQFFQAIYKLWGKNYKADLLLHVYQKYKYISSPVKTIKNTEKAYVAFEKMSTLNLSGLAVVNEKGKIIHNTSATDIKLWLIASNTLEESIETFLINIRKLSLNEKYPITVCSLKDTFARAMAKLQATKYHRLWIVDDDGCPVGVLALTDIFKFLVAPTKEELNESKNDKKNDNKKDDKK